MSMFAILVLFALSVSTNLHAHEVRPKLLAATVATEATDGYMRYIRSLAEYNYTYETYGMGNEWRGGNVKRNTGGGQKINILLQELAKYRYDENLIIVFTDAYDVLFVQEPDELVRKFETFRAKIVFGAEDFCWPDESLIDDYPEVGANEKRFLNSGGFIGYAPYIYDVLTTATVRDNDDDQLYYTKIFLNKQTRDRWNIRLDTRSEIFQNLNGASHEISIFVDTSDSKKEIKMLNNQTNSNPVIVHGNGGSKMVLNKLGNYLARAYSSANGCRICMEDTLRLDPENKSAWPDVTIGVFVEEATPFLREFLDRLTKLNYPKSKLSLLVHNNVDWHTETINSFVSMSANDEYKEVKYIAVEDDASEHEARTQAIQECVISKCSFYMSLDSTVHLDNAETLRLLIEQNRSILSPVLVRPRTTWSNVWGAVNEKGFYARSDDYLDIINGERLGVWNVPYVSGAVLFNGSLLRRIKISYEHTFWDASMALATLLRDNDIFMYASNMHSFGHLVNPDAFNTSLVRPEMFEIETNFDDWSRRYISKAYYEQLSMDASSILMPCPDVFWFPVVTDEFCDDLIVMMESFGEWSGGRDYTYDPRLPGAHENVPTVDIHMTQVNWQTHWLFFLRKIIQPMQRKLFIGYYHDPPEASLNFVVRYRPDEQDSLKPHHDASTYTLNIALNRPGADFSGGGCRFVRYNCSVTDMRKGWALVHPGRLTHYHEGLRVTNGTRYIMVSFIDP